MGKGKKGRGNTTKQNTQSGGQTASASRATSSATKTASATPTQEQIAQRAEHLWRQSGCLDGRDEQNWREAEAQLRKELAAK